MESKQGAEEFERQLERSQLFTHTALGVAFNRVADLTAFLHAALDLLMAKGILSEQEVRAATGSIYQQLAERGELNGPGLLVRVDPPEQPRPTVNVDCEARMPICHAVCCKLTFALSLAEVEGGKLKWDLGQPYTIRQQRDGYCTHNNRATGGCEVYADRPVVCRRYSCAGDPRIWKDFEGMRLNQEWIDEHLNRSADPRLIAMFGPGDYRAE
jgi:Fe-S-cluster containining protein